ncbi:hypothetical protein ACWCRD_09040 [Streptomyces sp. NPDC002092]
MSRSRTTCWTGSRMRQSAEPERLANEVTVCESMVFLVGAAYTGPGPGVRTESRGLLMPTYLTDVRGERIVVVQVSWFG